MHLDLLTSLLLLLVFARLLGKAFKSLGQHEIVGEVLAGLLLGPVILNLVPITPELNGIVRLAVFLLIFASGLEIELHEVLDALKKKAFLSALFGFLVPLVSGFGVGQLYGFGLIESSCIGLCLAITSLPVVLSMLSSFKLHDTPIGHIIIGAAIVIDIIALLLLGVIFDTPADADLLSMLKSVFKTVLSLSVFFSIILGANFFLRNNFLNVARTKKLYQKAVDAFGDEGIFGMSILFVLAFSSISEMLGLHFVIGAFFGGLLINRDIMGSVFFKKLNNTLESVSDGFLTPIFFASIGMQLRLSTSENLDILLVLVSLGLVTKFFGSWMGARLGGIGARESIAMGIFLNSRGVMDLVIADLALQKGLISGPIFTALVLLSVFSAILVPLFYKKVGEKNSPSNVELAT